MGLGLSCRGGQKVAMTQSLSKIALRRATIWLGGKAAGAEIQFRHHFIERNLPVTDKLVGDYGLTALVDLDRDGDPRRLSGKFAPYQASRPLVRGPVPRAENFRVFSVFRFRPSPPTTYVIPSFWARDKNRLSPLCMEVPSACVRPVEPELSSSFPPTIKPSNLNCLRPDRTSDSRKCPTQDLEK
jgi:hypothetical protein